MSKNSPKEKQTRFNNKWHAFWYRIAVITCTFVVAAIPIIAVFAERVNPNIDERTIRNTQETLTTEARAAHVAYVTWKCVSKSIAEYPTSGYKGTKLLSEKDDYIIGSMTTGGTVNAGAWLEKKVGGDVEDGAIYCDEKNAKLLDVFAQQVGVNTSTLMCDGDSPGLFHMKSREGECDLSSSNKHQFDSGWWSYFGELYDKKAEEMNWNYRWADIAQDGWVYPDVIGYTMYVSEVEVGCGNQKSTKPRSGYITTPLTYVNENGEVAENWFTGSDDAWVVPETSNWTHHAFVVRGNDKTCKEMVELANEKAEYFRDEIKKLIEDGCKAAYTEQYEKAQEQLTTNGDSLTDEKKSKLENAIAEYESMASSGSFTEPYGDGGLQCKDTTDLATVTQTSWVDPDANGDDDAGAAGDTCADPAANPSDSICQETACYNQAKSMGWIICPIIFGIDQAASNIYNDIIEPMLAVNEGIVGGMARNGADGNAMLKAWATFRNLANIIFIIMFLIIIFSQLTGIGIDNYGIKKMLPRLLVTAILVNLSFVLCGVAVDLSNILGSGLRQLFIDLAQNVVPQCFFDSVSGAATCAAASTDDMLVKNIVAGVLVGIALAGTGAIAVIMVGGWAVLIPILLFLLSMVIAIIFGFIILGVRQALIIILIVISPVAIVLYALPNAAGISKKWFNLFKGVLMVYPVTGALVGSGYLASRIILAATGDDFFMTLVGAMICVVPYFFIPSLTRKSLDAIGGIGSRLSGMGSRLGNGARGLRNTEALRNKMEHSRDAARNRKGRMYNATLGKGAAEAIKTGKVKTDANGRQYYEGKNGRKRYISTEKAKRITEGMKKQTENADAVQDARRAALHQGRVDKFAADFDAERDAQDIKDLQSKYVNENWDIDRTQKALRDSLAQDESTMSDEDKRQNHNKIKALTNHLAANGSAGAKSAIRQAYVDASGIVEGQNRAMSGGAVGAFAQNLAVEHKDIAEGQGLKDFARAHMNDNDSSTQDYIYKDAAGNEMFQGQALSSMTTAQQNSIRQQHSNISASGVQADFASGAKPEDLQTLGDQALADIANDTAMRSSASGAAARAAEDIVINNKSTADWSQAKLNNLASIATNGQVTDWGQYQQSIKHSTVHTAYKEFDASTGGYRDIVGGRDTAIDFNKLGIKAADVDHVRKNGSGEIEIVMKDNSFYNKDTGVMNLGSSTPTGGGPTGGGPTGGGPTGGGPTGGGPTGGGPTP